MRIIVKHQMAFSLVRGLPEVITRADATIDSHGFHRHTPLYPVIVPGFTKHPPLGGLGHGVDIDPGASLIGPLT